MSSASLLELFSQNAGYASDKWEQYLPIYEAELGARVEAGAPLRLLEIGVENGGSLQLWARYFPSGSTIVGMDIDQNCSKLKFDESVKLIVGDATDKEFLDSALRDTRFDVIIDDGSHDSPDVIKTFEALFPRLDFGGKYFIEDLHASYWQDFGGGFRKSGAAVEYLKSLIDSLHFDHIEQGEPLSPEEKTRLGVLNRAISRISFHDSIVIIEKYESLKARRFARIITGQNFTVTGGGQVKNLVRSQRAKLFFNAYSAQEVYAELLGDLTRSETDVKRLQTELAQRSNEQEQRLARLEQSRAELATQIAQKESENAEIATQLARAEAEIGRHETAAEIASLMDQVAQNESENAEIATKLARVEADLALQHRRIDGFLSSTSWRLTAPLRWTKHLATSPRQSTKILAQRLRSPAKKLKRGIAQHAKLIAASGLFDRDWYLAQNPDVAKARVNPIIHYLRFGAFEGRDPSPSFASSYYLHTYPDVASSGGNPLVHYLLYGRNEGRIAKALPPAPAIVGNRATAFADSAKLSSKPPASSVITAGSGLRQRHLGLIPLRTVLLPSDQRRLSIITDSINQGSLYGGVATAMILAALLAQHSGARLRLITRTQAPVRENFGQILNLHGVQFSDDIEFVHLPASAPPRDVPIADGDAFLTTSWWSTWLTRQSVEARRIAYLLQEDERMFYPRGDDRLVCTETLLDPEITFVVNSQLLFDHLTTGPDALTNIAASGNWFEPAFPTTKPNRSRIQGVRRGGAKGLFFYARPNNIRNLFFRGLEAICAAIEEGVLSDKEWQFYFVGKDIPTLRLPDDIQPIILENLPWDRYSDLIRQIDLGLCLMDTPHPSYPPLDLASAGAVVLTNRCLNKTSLESYSRNILCVDATLDDLRHGIAEGVSRATNVEQRLTNLDGDGIQRDWRNALDRVVRHLSSILWS